MTALAKATLRPGGVRWHSHLARTTFLLVAAATLLGGCVTLIPKSAPVQLYTFVSRPPDGPTLDWRGRTPLEVAPLRFTEPAQTDRLLTRTGNKVANIAGARWVSPADVLFEESLSSAFDDSRMSIATRGRGPHSHLRVEVETFEVRYATSSEIPTVVVALRATFTSAKGVAVEKEFQANEASHQNRIGAIVAAYTKAVRQVNVQVVGWVSGDIP